MDEEICNDCVVGEYFCSRSCRNAALIKGTVKQEDIIGFKIKKKNHIDEELQIEEEICTNCVIGEYFCSRSCRNAALIKGTVNHEDIINALEINKKDRIIICKKCKPNEYFCSQNCYDNAIKQINSIKINK